MKFSPRLTVLPLTLAVTAILLITLTAGCHGYDGYSSNYQQPLSRLDSVLQFRNKYLALKLNHIDSVRLKITDNATSEPRLSEILRYAKLWKGLSADSAILYCNYGIRLAIQAHDSLYVQRFYCERATVLLCSGQIYDAIEDLKHIRTAGPLPEVKADYNRAGFIVYFTLGTFYQPRERQTDYLKYARIHLENLIDFYPPNSADYHYYRGFLYLVDHKDWQALDNFEWVTASTDQSSPINTGAHSAIGLIYYNSEDFDQAAYHLAIAARQNTLNANLYETSLLMLGEALSRIDEPERASHYLTASLENSINGDMRFNLMRLNNVLLKVNSSLEKERSRRVTTLTIMTIILALLLAIVLKMSLNKRREVKQLRKIERRLARAGVAKDTYIKEFMNLCSDYIESFETYNKLSKHKIATGQHDQVLAIMKSGKIIDDQREKFYEVFDKSVLQLFPDFVKNVNSLLQPDHQIKLTKEGTLTTELRILALSRLGIDDVKAISRFLGISPNSIYTYRNKLRLRSINRATFDEDTKHISTI
ncbi:MAG: hypothetical protein HDS49_03515 [Bacteroides sp.]|nr:hypothetical protein [Bacteroides sp.]